MKLSTSQFSLRNLAVDLFHTGIAAADPYQAVMRCLSVENERLHIRLNDGGVRTGNWRQIHLIAFGKAACPMMKAALAVIPTYKLGEAIAVTNFENISPIHGIDVIGAGHPLPDESGLQAAQRIADIARAARSDDLVLVLVSGGGSALIPYPVAAIGLADKIAVTQLLLASGANINEINCVRKHLSQLKGGGLARLIAPAVCHALVLSDVLGDDLSSIASGSTVPDETTFADAVNILQHYGLLEKVPDNVRQYLASGLQGNVPETPKPNDACFANTDISLIGSNRISLDAVMESTREHGFVVILYSDNLCGEARIAARDFAAFAIEQSLKFKGKVLAIVAGGETTVTIKGKGKGGRNQELALAFAIEAEKQDLTGNWVFLSGGTDGRDGPTDAAGGIVDHLILQRIRAAGGNPDHLLADNDSYTALKLASDLLMTGATGTNVADLQVLLMRI